MCSLGQVAGMGRAAGVILVASLERNSSQVVGMGVAGSMIVV